MLTNDKFKRMIVLGFYDRNNIGDDSYTSSFRELFGNMYESITFACMDDIQSLPEDTSVVICGGGDIINDYFMKKARRILHNFTGHIYAVSVGIPYPSCAKYLNMFDHVFVRSARDFEIASQEIGTQNTTQCSDASVLMKPLTNIPRLMPRSSKVIGLCMAQPVFYKNPNKDILIRNIVSTLKQYDVQWCWISFNYNTANPSECDILLREDFEKAGLTFTNDLPEPPTNPDYLLAFMKSQLDGCICMRYHSIMFSLIAQLPFIALTATSKVRNIIQDTQHRYHVPVDAFDTTAFNEYVLSLVSGSLPPTPLEIDPGMASGIRELVSRRKPKALFIKRKFDTEQTIISRFVSDLSKYFHISLIDSEKLIMHRGAFIPPARKELLDVARFICYSITGSTEHPCLWGLYANMRRDTFNLREAIVYIYNEVRQPFLANPSESYLPALDSTSFKRRCTIKLDSVLANNFASYHRSGWGYTLGGLYHLDMGMLDRNADLYVDTYLDRTFHWGYDTLKSIGVIPYRSPWMGFIHHTFNTTHSIYNLEEMFANADFIESLKTCKGLIVLSNDLASKVRQVLGGTHNVPVHVLYHPMLTVAQTFSFADFINKQPATGVIQIGAWLRKPYSIYRLNSKGLTKMALMGKEMDMYFPPADYIERLEALKGDGEVPDQTSITSMCRSFHSYNKFVLGAVQMLQTQLESVRILQRVTNEAYDKLLSENVVFLDLEDCSAVNTVIECIVRHTPVIVNRLPALIEILGPDYPGFYDDLEEAGAILSKPNIIYNIHIYLKKLDKSRYSLEHFVQEFQKIILDEPRQATYPLFTNISSAERFRLPRFEALLKRFIR